MARGKKKEELALEEKLERALVPVEEQPYEVPENWCWTRLREVSEVVTGSTPSKKKSEYYGEEFPFFKPADLDAGRKTKIASEYLSSEGKKISRVIPAKSTAVCCIGSIGKSGYLEVDGTTNQQINSVIPKINSLYLYYFINTETFINELWKKSSATTISIVNKSKMEQNFVPLPPLPEQQRIVERIENLFSKLDEAKEKVQEVIQLSKIRQLTLINHMFTGELAGITDVCFIPLLNIVEEIKIGPFGSSLHKGDYIMDGIPVINPKHITKQEINPDKKISITIKKARELLSYGLKTNDIIMGRRGEMGRTAPVSQKEEGYICGTGSLIIRLKKGFRADLYSQILGSQSVINYLERNCVGSTMKNLNEKIVRQIPVPYFTDKQQEKLMLRYEKMVTDENGILDNLSGIADTIDLVKKSILAKAFRGVLGTNNLEEESSADFLKQILEQGNIK